MKIGDLVKFKEGQGWETVGLVKGTAHIDMFLIYYSTPCDPLYPQGWHPLKHLETVCT